MNRVCTFHSFLVNGLLILFLYGRLAAAAAAACWFLFSMSIWSLWMIRFLFRDIYGLLSVYCFIKSSIHRSSHSFTRWLVNTRFSECKIDCTNNKCIGKRQKNSETSRKNTHSLTHSYTKQIVEYVKNNQFDWMGVARVFGSPSLHPIHPQAIHDFHIIYPSSVWFS